MSKTAIIVIVFVALALGGTLLLLNQQPKSPTGNGGSTAAAGPAFEIDPSRVEAFSVTDTTGPTRTVFRTEDNNWIYAELPVTAQPDAGWPADASRVQTALRSLTPIPAAGEAEGTAMSESAPTIELRMADGDVRSLQIERESIGGNVLARVDGERLVLISADSVSDILSEGPGQWRIQGPLAGITNDASRLTIVAGDQRIALAKIEDRWIMRAPISARADESVIRTVFEAILNMRITEFNTETQLTVAPVVTIEVERDDLTRSDGSTRRVTTRTLEIGPVNPAGNGRVATLSGSNLPERTSLLLERGSIQTDQQFANLARAEAYLSKIALPEQRSDIGIVLFRPLGDPSGDRGFRRDIEGWNEMRPDGGMRTAELPDRESLMEALTLLGEKRGTPRIASEVEDFRALTRLELYTLDDADLGTLQIGYSSDALAVRRGNILWLYPDAPIPALFMLPAPDAVQPETPREPSEADQYESDDNK